MTLIGLIIFASLMFEVWQESIAAGLFMCALLLFIRSLVEQICNQPKILKILEVKSQDNQNNGTKSRTSSDQRDPAVGPGPVAGGSSRLPDVGRGPGNCTHPGSNAASVRPGGDEPEINA